MRKVNIKVCKIVYVLLCNLYRCIQQELVSNGRLYQDREDRRRFRNTL